ncbi:YsnF/AvaK domain-containing protein [Jannaschia sp. R86511]|uniref:YsnF/AvaK domain-containing protein n=1 Tax=Jannaschia sp. R86511 TaxID=3093853 RepID=UPI0036D29F5B
MITTDQIQSVLSGGGTVLGRDGDKIGGAGQVFLDDQTGAPEWVTVKTGLFGGSESFVPLAEASVTGSDITVPYDKATVKDAPRMDADGHLSPQQEDELYRYYGMAYSEQASDSGLPAGGRQDQDLYDQDRSDQGRDDRRDVAGEAGVVGQDTSGPTTDDAMTRSEEKLHVGTEKVATGKARLRKFIVTENVTTTVPVSHEEVRMVTEPITDANRGDAMSGGDLTEEEHEVVLTEERVVVNKETVPVERVRLDTETVTESREVSEEVRKEQIEQVDVTDSTRTNPKH